MESVDLCPGLSPVEESTAAHVPNGQFISHNHFQINKIEKDSCFGEADAVCQVDGVGQFGASSARWPPEYKHAIQSISNDIPPPPAQFADKLYTNYIPNSTEIHQIKQYVFKINKQLSAHDARIVELEGAIQELVNKRLQLYEVANAHEALVSPLRRLPPEILQMIFVFCLPSNRNAVMHASEAPVLLGRVCSEWRRVSLATPEVWSSLHIVPPNVNFSNAILSTARFQRKRELIRTWLSRSGTCPLSISFLWLAGDSEVEIQLCSTLLEVLVPICNRWKALDFRVPLKMFRPFMGLSVKDVPLLECVSFMDNSRTSPEPDIDRWPEALGFAENAMTLRSFTLTFFSGGIRLPSIPWSQLTSLYLESNIAFFFPDSREMLNILAQCSNLQSCTLKFPLSHTASLPAFEKFDIPITLPQLQTLYIDGDQHLHNTFHMSNILMNFITPKLRVLEILGRFGRPEGNAAPEPLSAIRTLLARSKCPLERLNLESIAILPHEFIECLWLAPCLKDLVVQNLALRMQFGLGAGIGEEDQVVTDGQLGSGTTNDLGDLARQNWKETAPYIPENLILKALTLKSKRVDSKGEESFETNETGPDLQGASDSTSLTSPSFISYIDGSISLCPRLQRFEFTLCDASQSLFCDFISSRWSDVPEGAVRIKSVKCTFTAFEDEMAKKKLQEFRSEGLDAFITYQVPINDDLNPSPWTGLEGP